ncbi:MAG TPA: ankyrin repeat domain-containing protein [Candidatus Ozemobacteraceae bacterium]|nr:ankyrin repeat domain-containing protein [Candidatus Ozemobacteraceae bacterium]
MNTREQELIAAIARKDEVTARSLMTGDLEPHTAEAAAKAAMEAGMIELFQELIRRALPLVDSLGETWLMKAAFMGNLLFVQLLHGGLGMPVNHQSRSGATALIRGCLSGKTDVVRYLVDHGANLNAEEKIGGGSSVLMGWESFCGTPLMAAIVAGNDEAVRLLIERGADLTIRNSRTFDALEMAIRLHRLDAMNALAKARGLTLIDLLMTAARLNREVVRHLVESAHADVNARDAHGMTAVHQAARYGNYSFIHERVSRGAVNGAVEMIEYLLSVGARVDDPGPGGATPLMYAAETANGGLIDFLLGKGANPDARDAQGRCAAEYVKYPEAPPESWENAYEAWGWECHGLSDLENRLIKSMRQPPTPPKK